MISALSSSDREATRIACAARDLRREEEEDEEAEKKGEEKGYYLFSGNCSLGNSNTKSENNF